MNGDRGNTRELLWCMPMNKYTGEVLQKVRPTSWVIFVLIFRYSNGRIYFTIQKVDIYTLNALGSMSPVQVKLGSRERKRNGRKGKHLWGMLREAAKPAQLQRQNRTRRFHRKNKIRKSSLKLRIN